LGLREPCRKGTIASTIAEIDKVIKIFSIAAATRLELEIFLQNSSALNRTQKLPAMRPTQRAAGS